MIRGLEPLCWEKRLGELGLVNPGKGRLLGGLRAAFQQLMRKMGTDFIAGPVATGQGVMALN